MKISKVQIPSFIKNVALTAPLLLATETIKAQNNNLQQDVFQKSNKIEAADINTFSPRIKIDGKHIYPALVVDISDGMLYQYDYDTSLIGSYPVRMSKKDIEPGINTIDITAHHYPAQQATPKIILTKINRSSGKVAKTHQQVIVGSESEKAKDDWGIATNVILTDKNVAKKITKFLTNEQFVLIRK